MKSLSLIQAIVLLSESQRLKKSIHLKEKIDRLEASRKNLDLARELAQNVLGRNLKPLPLQTQILFLLIERMAENNAQRERSNVPPFDLASNTFG